MTSTIRVASTVELPPGKGKVVEVAGRYVTVFNREGRFYASTTHVCRRAPLLDTSSTCPAPGRGFDVYMEDSPARRRDEHSCLVRVDEDGIWLILD
jgi:nitrite reductase/ring-hydroxylating ferredoxin subunit